MGSEIDNTGAPGLAAELSPYLRQQASDAVRWLPWGPQALQLARSEDKPIFLSVGYSTCRWCHIMARESFNDTTTASCLNQHFINIKVDREERPDIDAIYMAATQIYNHSGGWPNSVFLTPDLEPYFCGTFFSLEDAGPDQPGFRSVAESMAHAWQHRRAEVLEQAQELAAVMRRFLSERGPQGKVPGHDMVRRAVGSLAERYDATWGGFGEAAKFPTPSNLLLLLEMADDDPPAAEMLEQTLAHMARGGIHDALGGGFHRYATDRQWRRPHFEKLLLDNAWLLEIYARQASRGSQLAKLTARRLADFLVGELARPEAAFYSAIDGETEGREGEYYLWSHRQLVAALGAENASFLAPFLGYDGPPTLGEFYVLRWPSDLAEQAIRRRLPADALEAEVEPLMQRLLEARDKRQQPHIDHKVLCDANGQAVAALAHAAKALDDAALLDKARLTVRWLLVHMRGPDGVLQHSYGKVPIEAEGQAKFDAFLADYAYLLRGLMALHTVDPADEWLKAGHALAEEMIARLWDAEHGGFWMFAPRQDPPFRNKEIFDGAYPAGNALALLGLLELDRQSATSRYGGHVTRALQGFAAPAQGQVESLRALAVVVRQLSRQTERSGQPSQESSP